MLTLRSVVLNTFWCSEGLHSSAPAFLGVSLGHFCCLESLQHREKTFSLLCLPVPLFLSGHRTLVGEFRWLAGPALEVVPRVHKKRYNYGRWDRSLREGFCLQYQRQDMFLEMGHSYHRIVDSQDVKGQEWILRSSSPNSSCHDQEHLPLDQAAQDITWPLMLPGLGHSQPPWEIFSSISLHSK